MLTRWGRELDTGRPLPEYPRPQLVRDRWVNLNGPWQHAFTEGPGRPDAWAGTIVVPFSPEAPLSGVGRQLLPGQWLWYRRAFRAPEPPPGGRVLLHVGAADQRATVWVNDAEAGAHTGGYLPFSLDVTDLLRPGANDLLVRVRDLSETAPHARGKQRLERGGIWYTAQSGLWQTVWLEPVPAVHITHVDVHPDLAHDRFTLAVHTSDGATHRRAVALDDPRRWTPEDPHLHHFEVTVGEDTVRCYGALRSVGTGADAHGRPRLLLNGEPYLHVGVLDQGYWPDGLLTPPSDEAMVHDISTAKSLGFTMIRKHAKIEPLRWYHHCDRLGMLVWQDIVNGGGRYRSPTTRWPATRPVRLPDRFPLIRRLYGRSDRAGREEFRDEVRATLRLLGSSPCVAVWTIFNEGWGQFDANALAAEVARLDPTRPVHHASGWVDQGGGDIRSFHRYVRPWRMPRRNRGGRVIALTEYGGYGLPVPGHSWGDRHFGYRTFRTGSELAEAFTALHRDDLAPTVPQGLSATAYTQLCDVEDETNGLLTYDREVLKIPAEAVREALAHLTQEMRSSRR